MRRLLYLGWVYGMIAVWTVVVFPSSFVVTLATRSHRIGHRIHSAFWGRMILRSCGVRLRVHHVDRLHPAGAYVLMINHNSHFAGYAVAAGIPLQWRAVLGMKLRKIPVFAWIALLAGHIFVDTRHTSRAIATLNAAAEKIRNGISVLIFPEGAHHESRDLLPFRAGGFHLAIRAGVPIVPLTVVEERRRGPAGIVHRIHLHVDEPIPTHGQSPSDVPQLIEKTRSAMTAHLNAPVSE